MTSPEHIRVADSELHALVRRIYAACGMDETHAGLMADSHVQSDLRGAHSHGVLRVPGYIDRLVTGGVDPRGQPSISREYGACLVVDGGNSMGQIGCRFAMEQTLDRAERHGIAACAIGGSNHCGALAPYAMQALAHEMIGVFTTHSMPIMAPWGGAERLIGNNPLAIALPAQRQRPVVHDGAFSAAAYGKVRYYQQQGWDLPAGWAFDKDGRPTLDTAAALDGLLAPIGDFKGAALGMIMGLFAALLSGAAYGTELGGGNGQGARAGQDSQFALAIKIEAFVDPGTFKTRVDKAVQQIHACRRAPGIDRLYAPGELEFIQHQEYSRDGIPLNPVTLADLARVARDLAVDSKPFPWLPRN